MRSWKRREMPPLLRHAVHGEERAALRALAEGEYGHLDDLRKRRTALRCALDLRMHDLARRLLEAGARCGEREAREVVLLGLLDDIRVPPSLRDRLSRLAREVAWRVIAWPMGRTKRREDAQRDEPLIRRLALSGLVDAHHTLFSAYPSLACELYMHARGATLDMARRGLRSPNVVSRTDGRVFWRRVQACAARAEPGRVARVGGEGAARVVDHLPERAAARVRDLLAEHPGWWMCSD